MSEMVRGRRRVTKRNLRSGEGQGEGGCLFYTRSAFEATTGRGRTHFIHMGGRVGCGQQRKGEGQSAHRVSSVSGYGREVARFSTVPYRHA